MPVFKPSAAGLEVNIFIIYIVEIPAIDTHTEDEANGIKKVFRAISASIIQSIDALGYFLSGVTFYKFKICHDLCACLYPGGYRF